MKDQNNTNEQIDSIDNEYRKAIGAIINLKQIESRARSKYNMLVQILTEKKPKEALPEIKETVINKSIYCTTYEIYDYTNGVNMAIILGEILGKSREEILDDVGLECNLDENH